MPARSRPVTELSKGGDCESGGSCIVRGVIGSHLLFVSDDGDELSVLEGSSELFAMEWRGGMYVPCRQTLVQPSFAVFASRRSWSHGRAMDLRTLAALS